MFVMKAAMATNSGKPVCYYRVSTPAAKASPGLALMPTAVATPPISTAVTGTIQHYLRISLRHAAGHEAADRGPKRTLHRPNHRPARPVRLGDNSIIGDVDPLAIEPDTIVSVGGFPIDVG